jgi:hypothetical protein
MLGAENKELAKIMLGNSGSRPLIFPKTAIVIFFGRRDDFPSGSLKSLSFFHMPGIRPSTNLEINEKNEIPS